MKRDWLNHIRKYKRMTQQQVAFSSFIDRSYYSQIESGKRNPSLNVAKNVAKVLDFDPLLFFQDDHKIGSPEETILNQEIYESFKKLDRGQILYLYSNDGSYLQHAITFFLIGVRKKSHCLLIDNQTNFSCINKFLEIGLTKDEINNYINFINLEHFKKPETQGLFNHLKVLLAKFEEKSSIGIWSHEQQNHLGDWVFKLQNYLNSEDIIVKNKKILSVYSNNASIVSARTHIKMMRKFPYLMTDFEIVESPLYNSNENPSIFPSFFIQENM